MPVGPAPLTIRDSYRTICRSWASGRTTAFGKGCRLACPTCEYSSAHTLLVSKDRLSPDLIALLSEDVDRSAPIVEAWLSRLKSLLKVVATENA